jgi:diacylglycerol O-acyltransferase
MWQVDGLDGGRWALVVKAHHTMVDGFVGTGLLTSLLSGDGPEPAHAPLRIEVLPAPGAPEVARAAAAWTASLPCRAGRSLARLVTEPDRVRERTRRLRAGVRTVAVPDLPPNVLAGPLGRRRLWRWVSYDLPDIEAAAARAGCTVNDVFLAALAGGYRRHLRTHAALAHDTRLRSIVPVSMRTGRDDRRSGNIDAALFVDLPVHEGDARARLADVARQTRTAKQVGVSTSTEALVRAADHVPAPVLDRAARAYVRRGQRRVNVAASNVTGPTEPLRVCGRRLLELVPYLPVALEVRTSCGLLSYADRASLSVTADADGCPDLDGLVSAIDASMAELLALPAADDRG